MDVTPAHAAWSSVRGQFDFPEYGHLYRHCPWLALGSEPETEKGVTHEPPANEDLRVLINHFPLLGLRLTTPRLELRLPSPEELGNLADLAADGIHEPEVMPFVTPWTDQPAAEVARTVVQNHWLGLGKWSPRDWSLNLAVLHAGVVVGTQTIRARDFGITLEVGTGSWLGRRHQGQGIGTEMRAAVLHLAFAGLGAEEAVSAALDHNVASRAVSRKLGYKEDGIERRVVRGASVLDHRMRLTRSEWRRHHTIAVTIDGLAPCLPLFGVNAE